MGKTSGRGGVRIDGGAERGRDTALHPGAGERGFGQTALSGSQIKPPPLPEVPDFWRCRGVAGVAADGIRVGGDHKSISCGTGVFRSSPAGAGVHERLKQLLNREEVYLDGLYVCPHKPDDDCDCRKPKLGLLQKAAEDLAFDMESSIVIGDKPSDIEMGAGTEQRHFSCAQATVLSCRWREPLSQTLLSTICCLRLNSFGIS